MNRLLIDCSVHQTRIGLVEEGRLAELWVESKKDKSSLGNLYAARVEAVLTGMQAAFVDIGQEKNAYFYYGQKRAETDSPTMPSKKPKHGDTILVQVVKEAAGTKGAVVTDRLSLAGKFLVLLLTEPEEFGISHKIEDKKERHRIQKLLEKMLPKEYGIIVRTNGAEKTEAEFAKELEQLIALADSIKQKGQFLKPPALVYEDGDVLWKQLRDRNLEQVEEIVVNDAEVANRLSSQIEGNTKVVLFSQKEPLFSNYFVEKQAEKALEKRVWLKSGGFFIIEQTEACVVIDVNTGKYTGKKNLQKTLLQTNLEAAEEIANQIRLRNLSGMIIIDFIDMVEEADKQRLTKALKEAVKRDSVKTTVVGMTELGLMQMTRKKTRPSLQQTMTTKCRCCEGTGRVPSLEWVIGKMRREVVRYFANTIYAGVEVIADPRLLSAFCGEGDSFRKELEAAFEKKIVCIPQTMDFGAFLVKEWIEKREN